jgi:transcriptional regulator with XRE-family HTH domain
MAAALEVARINRGMSRGRLARLVGTSDGFIGDLETTRRQLTLSMAYRLAPPLGIDPSRTVCQFSDGSGPR